MDARELRIGNYIRRLAPFIGNPIVKVIGTNYAANSGLSTIYDSAGGYGLSQYYEPIPLTPEILEKAGFVSEQEGYNDFDIKATWVYDAFIVVEYNNGDFVFDHEMNIEPLCVHSLQNLYFALTQTELPINL